MGTQRGDIGNPDDPNDIMNQTDYELGRDEGRVAIYNPDGTVSLAGGADGADSGGGGFDPTAGEGSGDGTYDGSDPEKDELDLLFPKDDRGPLERLRDFFSGSPAPTATPARHVRDLDEYAFARRRIALRLHLGNFDR